MKRTKPTIKVDGASLILYPRIKGVFFTEGLRDLVEFKVNIRSIQLAAALDPTENPEHLEVDIRRAVSRQIDRRMEALQALKTQVLLGSTNLLDTDTEDT